LWILCIFWHTTFSKLIVHSFLVLPTVLRESSFAFCLAIELQAVIKISVPYHIHNRMKLYQLLSNFTHNLCNMHIPWIPNFINTLYLGGQNSTSRALNLVISTSFSVHTSGIKLKWYFRTIFHNITEQNWLHLPEHTLSWAILCFMTCSFDSATKISNSKRNTRLVRGCDCIECLRDCPQFLQAYAEMVPSYMPWTFPSKYLTIHSSWPPSHLTDVVEILS